MKTMMLHCGANKVDLETVNGVNTPTGTASWQPVAHSYLINKVRSGLEGSGTKVANEAHSLTHDGLRYFGLFQLANEMDKPYSTILGLRNSHDKKFPAGLVFGANVFVCDNLSFSGEVKLQRRHTLNVFRDLPGVIARAIGSIGDHFRFQDLRFDAYQNVDISEMEASHLIIKGFEVGACNVTDIRGILNQWRSPNHDDFKPRNAWSLFNAFTEVGKGNLLSLPKKTQALHSLLDGRCGLTDRLLLTDFEEVATV
jgi:hypothetical protein